MDNRIHAIALGAAPDWQPPTMTDSNHVMLSQLRQKKSSAVFDQHLPDLESIRRCTRESIIPSISDELEASGTEVGQEGRRWLDEWACDIGQIFRIFKKHDYRSEATLTAIRKNLLWRYKSLRHLPPPSPSPVARVIPHPVLSTYSDVIVSTPPIVHVSLQRLSKFVQSSGLTTEQKVAQLKTSFLQTFELIRLYLRDVDSELEQLNGGTPVDEGYGSSDDRSTPVDRTPRIRIFQFVLMIDIRGATMMPTIGADLARWLVNDIGPYYPGVCSAVYVVNYSWAYSAMWGIIKRLLPEKVLDRISFPSNGELRNHFPPESLLEDQGGTLPNLNDDFDEILERYFGKPSLTTEATSLTSQPELHEEDHTHSPPNVFTPSRYSSSNPYYGYSSIGPRRKRDLIRTLAFLFILKWKRRAQLVSAMLATLGRNVHATALKSVTMVSSGLHHMSLVPHLFFGGLNYRSRSRLSHPSVMPLLVAVVASVAAIMVRRQWRQGGSIFDAATLQNLLVALTASGVSGGMALSATGS